MTQILAFSGKKGSGKNTLCNFLHGYHLKSFNIIDNFEITDKGKLIIDTLVSNENGEVSQGKGLIDVERTDIEFAIWASNNMWPYVKHYAFGSSLKELCIGLFGIQRENIFGTDEQKNEFSKYKWENMPTKIKGKSGPMTYREFLQYIGTDICRKIYPNIWVDRTIGDVKAEESLYAVISDARFINEIETIKSIGGKVIRLTGGIDGDDHNSENELNEYSSYDAVIDTANQTIHESCQTLIKTLSEWDWLAKEIIIPEPEAPKYQKERFTSIK